MAATRVDPDEVMFRALDGACVRCAPPFPPLAEDERGEQPGFAPEPLLEHVRRERRVGVLLARLGGCAAGVFAGERLVASKVARRQVHGRHRAGGSSQGRFARRREGEARAALALAADVAARVLLPALDGLDGVVLGGDSQALHSVLADPRLAPLVPLVAPRVLTVPDPRLEVLRATPERFLATILTAVPAAPPPRAGPGAR